MDPLKPTFDVFHDTREYQAWDEETRHRYDTRIGCLCEDGPVSGEARAIAIQEARDHRKEQAR